MVDRLPKTVIGYDLVRFKASTVPPVFTVELERGGTRGLPMIACRGLLRRTERAWQFANTIVSSTPLSSFQRRGCCSYNGLITYGQQRFTQYSSRSMGRDKKRESVNPVWRPVSTSSSNAECSMTESENLISIESSDNADKGASSMKETAEAPSSINMQEKAEASDVEGVLFEATSSSSVLPGSDNIKGAEEVLAVSAAKHSVSIEVGASLMRFIKGKGGATQKNIEEKMGVKIIFPSSRNEDSIVIEGDSTESITKASDKIQAVINEAVQSPNLDYSHFISLPLALHPELVEKLLRFQDTILGKASPEEDMDENANDGSDRDASKDERKNHSSAKAPDVAVKLEVGDNSNHAKVEIKAIPRTSYQPKTVKSNTLSDLGIDKSIFIKPKTFHLTVLMLKLWNKERIHLAAEILQSIHTKVTAALDGRPLSIRLKGLDCMRGSLSKARVLYAPVEEIGNEDRLIHACQVIIDAYVEAGLVLEKDARQKLKLHATVMNARHRKWEKGTKKLDSFDARGIFEEYGSEEWGEYHIPEAHLSQRFAFDDNGYYHCCASIPFPGMAVE